MDAVFKLKYIFRRDRFCILWYYNYFDILSTAGNFPPIYGLFLFYFYYYLIHTRLDIYILVHLDIITIVVYMLLYYLFSTHNLVVVFPNLKRLRLFDGGVTSRITTL